MCSEPLDDYFQLAGIEPGFQCNCTALWRGYVGEWEITQGRLYLLKLTGTLEDGRPASLETFFPGFPERVFAHWYCGQIRLPQGRQLEYVHMGWASVYEQDLLIDFDKGQLTQTRVRHNSAPINAPCNAPSNAGLQVEPKDSGDPGSASFPREPKATDAP